jgi:hypothetical protein
VKVIAFEEHYKSHAIEQANKDHPIQRVYDEWKKEGDSKALTLRKAFHLESTT